jgi:hypothetical protein
MAEREVIAVVALSQGQVGYYDEYSKIYMTQANPVHNIYAGTNCTQIRRSIKSGRLRLISGSLQPKNKEKLLNTFKQQKKKEEEKAKTVVENITAPLVSETIVPEPQNIKEAQAEEIVKDVAVDNAEPEQEEVEEESTEAISEEESAELKTFKVSPAKVNKLAIDAAKKLSIKNIDEEYTAKFVSENEEVATVDEEGNVTGKAAGNTNIIVSIEGYEDKVVAVSVVE